MCEELSSRTYPYGYLLGVRGEPSLSISKLYLQEKKKKMTLIMISRLKYKNKRAIPLLSCINVQNKSIYQNFLNVTKLHLILQENRYHV